jgi:hypothetical protein
MKFKFEDVGSVGGFLSGAFILGSAVPMLETAVQALPYAGPALASGCAKLAAVLAANTPSFLAGAGAAVAKVLATASLGVPALGVVAAIGMAVMIPWAIRMTGKLIDGAVAQTEYGVERIKSAAIEGKEKIRYRQEYQQMQHAPVAAPPMAAVDSYHPADLAAARGVNYTENYLSSQQESSRNR